MKIGFYLSPCGKHIVQLQQSSSPYFLYVMGLSDKYPDFLFDIDKNDAEIIFSAWTRLN